MKLRLIVIVLIILFVKELQGEIVFNKEKSLFVKLYGGGSSASSIYDLDNNLLVSQIDDTSEYFEKDYTVELNKTKIGLLCEYFLNENLILYGNLPFTINTLDEKRLHIDDSTGAKYYFTKNRSLTHLEYLGIGAKYRFYNKKSYGVFLFESKIPPGFKKGLLDSGKKFFLGDGAFEIVTGLALGIKTDKYLFESMFLYNYRDEELEDQVIIRLEAGICTVPDTKLSVTGDFGMSIKSYKVAIPLKSNQYVTQEDYFAMGFEFSMFFSESIYGEFNYNLRLLGKNSWSLGTYRVCAGVLF